MAKRGEKSVGVRERAVQALQLRLAGASWRQIAPQVGYRQGASAYRAAMQLLDEQAKEPAEKCRALELARLDAMTIPLWPAVLRGDLATTAEVRHIVELRCRIQGLLTVPPPTFTMNIGPGAGSTFTGPAFVLPGFLSEGDRHEYLRHCAFLLGASAAEPAEVVAVEGGPPPGDDGNGAGPGGDGSGGPPGPG